MNQRIHRSFSKPKREGLTWDQKWKAHDKGLIISWEIGRELSVKEPELAIKAKNGELPILGWKGGIENKTNQKEKHGSLYYLAQWQGLRGEDLDIDMSQENVLICSKTGVKVTYHFRHDSW